MKHKHPNARRRCSPVLFDRQFKIQTDKVHAFVNLGFQAGNDGIQHTLFLPHPLMTSELFCSEQTSITGLCSYRYLYSAGSKIIQGVLFLTPKAKTKVTPYKLVVSNYELLPDSFVPAFNLEKLRLLYYTSTDGSVLVVSSDVESRLLVRVE